MNADTTSVNGTVIHGLYGTLTIGADGSYSYVVDNSNAAVQALDDGQTLVDIAFTYTATNGTTTATTTLTITVLGTNDAPVAHADTNSAQEGSSNATGNVLQTIAHPGTPSGTFSDIADTDVDIEPLTVTAIVSNFVGGSATAVGNGVTINGHYGALTINPDGSYSYKANSDIDNAEDVQDIFTYTVTDGTATSQATLTITIADGTDPSVTQNAIIAVDEAGLETINATGSAAAANVETNTGTVTFQAGSDNITGVAFGSVAGITADVNGVSGADIIWSPAGAFSDVADTDVDNATTLTVAHIQSATEDLAVTAGTTSANGTAIHGLYGTLTIGADGSYSYHPNENINNATDVQDVFTYTVTDGLAPVQTTLTITVSDGARPTHGNAITLDVDEAALSTVGATGSNPSSTAETDNTPSLSFTAGSDNLTSFAFSNTLSDLVTDLNGDGAQDIFWDRFSDTQIKGYLDGAHTQLAVTLDLSAPANIAAGTTDNVTVTMTLSDNLLHPNDLGGQVSSLGNVGVVATDIDGDATTGTVNLTVKNDVPTASVDTNNVNEGALLTVVAAAGVLTNDVAGADGFAAGGGVVGVRAAGNDPTTAVTDGAGTNITGLHGTLHLNADGSYTYQSNPNNISSNATDVFVYTIKDGDGDLSTTTLTINLADVTLVANNQTKTVDEAALDTSTAGSDLGHGTVTGSNPGSAAETVTGQLAVAGATSYTAQSLTTAHGLFQLNADGSYTYTLTSPVTETPANNGTDTINGVENFGYTAFDAFGNTINGTITINVKDDVPTAHADSGNVTEGRLLTVAALSGVLSNDVAGADGDSIAGIRAAGNDTTTSVSGGVGTDITGLHGTLHLNADGSYTYQSNPNNISSNATDVFVYTIKDGDGDLSTTTLTINLADVTLVANNQTKTVDEAALDTSTAGSDLGHGTVTGSNPGSAAETVTGQLAVAGAASYTAQSLSTAHGLFQLNADGSYTYTLTSPVTETPANNGTDTINGVENFGYTAFDAFGNTINGTITINVKDDTPIATPASNSGQSVLPDTNLLLTLDLSGSMDEASGVGTLTKLALAKQALLNLIQQYRLVRPNEGRSGCLRYHRYQCVGWLGRFE